MYKLTEINSGLRRKGNDVLHAILRGVNERATARRRLLLNKDVVYTFGILSVE